MTYLVTTTAVFAVKDATFTTRAIGGTRAPMRNGIRFAGRCGLVNRKGSPTRAFGFAVGGTKIASTTRNMGMAGVGAPAIKAISCAGMSNTAASNGSGAISMALPSCADIKICACAVGRATKAATNMSCSTTSMAVGIAMMGNSATKAFGMTTISFAGNSGGVRGNRTTFGGACATGGLTMSGRMANGLNSGSGCFSFAVALAKGGNTACGRCNCTMALNSCSGGPRAVGVNREAPFGLGRNSAVAVGGLPGSIACAMRRATIDNCAAGIGGIGDGRTGKAAGSRGTARTFIGSGSDRVSANIGLAALPCVLMFTNIVMVTNTTFVAEEHGCRSW